MPPVISIFADFTHPHRRTQCVVRRRTTLTERHDNNREDYWRDITFHQYLTAHQISTVHTGDHPCGNLCHLIGDCNIFKDPLGPTTYHFYSFINRNKTHMEVGVCVVVFENKVSEHIYVFRSFNVKKPRRAFLWRLWLLRFSHSSSRRRTVQQWTFHHGLNKDM